MSAHGQNQKSIHLTPDRLHKMSPNYSQLCSKCRADNGTVMQVFCDCDKIKGYWKEMHKITGKMFALSPKVYLLNCKASLCLDGDKESVLNFCLYLARK